MTPEQYIEWESIPGKSMQDLLDRLNPDARTRAAKGWTCKQTLAGRKFTAEPDRWVENKRRINPAWKAATIYVGIYGAAVAPHAGIVIRMTNAETRSQARLGSAVRKVIKDATGRPAGDQYWNYFGDMEKFPDSAEFTRYRMNPDLTFARVGRRRTRNRQS